MTVQTDIKIVYKQIVWYHDCLQIDIMNVYNKIS